jgi:hypothetical protein
MDAEGFRAAAERGEANMAYRSGDDPQLLSDLRSALKRWHRPTLGDTALAGSLASVQRRLVGEPWLSRSNALRQTIRSALVTLREARRAGEAELLDRHYLRNESVIRLTETYSLSERSLYYRLHEALVALAHGLWSMEQAEASGELDELAATESTQAQFLARNLPPQTYTHLFGTDEVLAQLLEYLDDPYGHWVISLDGMAGLGKTALAREAAGRIAKTDRFADIAWVTIRPAAYTSQGPLQVDSPSLTCGQVLGAMASQLDGADLGPLPLQVKRDRTRELLADRACLIVLDSLETALDCGSWPDWFWELAQPSKFLLTSRHWLDLDVGHQVLRLDPLSEADSLALIRHEAHRQGLKEVVEASDDALRPILAVTGGHALALRLVVGQLVSLPLSRILVALEAAQPGADPFYEYLYRVSWDLLSAPARHLLWRMAEVQACEVNWEDLAAISGLHGDNLNSAIEELAAHSLIQAAGIEKMYSLHPLTRSFALSQPSQSAEGVTSGTKPDA